MFGFNEPKTLIVPDLNDFFAFKHTATPYIKKHMKGFQKLIRKNRKS